MLLRFGRGGALQHQVVLAAAVFTYDGMLLSSLCRIESIEAILVKMSRYRHYLGDPFCVIGRRLAEPGPGTVITEAG